MNPYELGRQPFALAHPAALLSAHDCHVRCIDLSQQKLSSDDFADCQLVGIYLGMHTATRIALEALPRIRSFAPQAHYFAYGLYAPMNQALLRERGIDSIFGGEVEADLLGLVRQLRGESNSAPTAKVPFILPDRSGLPPLQQYARLNLPNGDTKMVAFAEATRGCKHLCRHCPVVPVYEGKFRAIPADIVLGDIAQQIELGAQHVSFGDPDFFNGPTHAKRIIEALHQRFPEVTYDAVIKIEHIIQHQSLLPLLRDTGCLFITSAVESVDDQVLALLDKGHTNAHFFQAVQLMRSHQIAIAPTFLPFTPWTSLESYLALLQCLIELRLVACVPPIQLAIRLLVPQGSYLLKLEEFRALVDEFDPLTLGFPWQHPDPTVDQLQRDIQALVESDAQQDTPRLQTFNNIWTLVHQYLGRAVPALPEQLGEPIPALSEPWYCCAEPTQQQLQSF